MELSATQKYFSVIKSKVTGWMVEPKMRQFEWMMNDMQEPLTIVEIGVWYGMSAIGIGMIAKASSKKATIYAIDAWRPDAAIEGENAIENKKWWENQNYNYALHCFKEYIEFFGLKDFFKVIVGRSEDVVGEIPNEIDLLHVDGNHSEEKSMRDIELYLPKVKQGGVICLDDTAWDTLAKAVAYMNENCEFLFEYNVDGASFNFYRKK